MTNIFRKDALLLCSSCNPTTSPSTVDNSTKNHFAPAASNAGTVVGGVIGGIVLLALLLIGLIMVLRYRRHKRTNVIVEPCTARFNTNTNTSTNPRSKSTIIRTLRPTFPSIPQRHIKERPQSYRNPASMVSSDAKSEITTATTTVPFYPFSDQQMEVHQNLFALRAQLLIVGEDSLQGVRLKREIRRLEQLVRKPEIGEIAFSSPPDPRTLKQTGY